MSHDKFCPADTPLGGGCECEVIAAIRADERERILAPHKEIDVDNSCGDPDCCGGPYPMMVCEVCGTDWPCSVVIAARKEDGA